jgi:uncharacterized SAM-binding protein YcdF (DUF218 family)
MCFQPSPKTTLGEARAIRDEAREHAWKTIIIVTSSYHVSRARMIFGRCFPGKILMTSPPVAHSFLEIAYQYVYQTVAYIKAALITRGC